MHLWLMGAIALAGSSAPALAQVAGTLETKSYPSTRDGAQVGCVIEFRTAVQDFAYRKGAAVIVSGSMGFMNYPGKQPAVTLKIVLNDVLPDGTIDTKTTAPTSISLVGPDGQSNVRSRIMSEPGELPGSRIAAFSLDGFPDIFGVVVDRKELAVLFNRREGGPDVRVLTDLTIEGLDDAGNPIRGTQTVRGFVQCAGKLLADIDASKPGK